MPPASFHEITPVLTLPRESEQRQRATLSRPPLESLITVGQWQGKATACQEKITASRRSFYLIFLLMEGEGEHWVGDRCYQMRANTVCLVAPHQVAAWEVKSFPLRGYYCAFTRSFLKSEADALLCDPAAEVFKLCPVLSLSPTGASQLGAHFESLLAEASQASSDQQLALRLHLGLLLLTAKRLFNAYPAVTAPISTAAERLVKLFFGCLEEAFALQKGQSSTGYLSVSTLARRLSVHPRHLNDTLRKVTGKCASEHLAQRLIQEASALLVQTTLTVAQIAFRLGFQDPAYFARYFGKCTGCSPKAYRKEKGPESS